MPRGKVGKTLERALEVGSVAGAERAERAPLKRRRLLLEARRARREALDCLPERWILVQPGVGLHAREECLCEVFASGSAALGGLGAGDATGEVVGFERQLRCTGPPWRGMLGFVRPLVVFGDGNGIAPMLGEMLGRARVREAFVLLDEHCVRSLARGGLPKDIASTLERREPVPCD
jgi:hypothetical protein